MQDQNVIKEINRVIYFLTVLSDNFDRNVENITFLSLKLWVYIARLAEMPLSKVSLEVMESVRELGFAETPVSVPGIGEVSINPAEGTAVFIDFTRSTDYFLPRKSYTGFVIFNAYLTVLRLYLLNEGGEFLENTGDGAFIFYPCRKLEYKEYLKFMFLSELLYKYAEEENLLERKQTAFALIHIGGAYDKGYLVNLGGERKFISPSTWEAAKNCKEAPRNFIELISETPENPFQKFSWVSLFRPSNSSDNYSYRYGIKNCNNTLHCEIYSGYSLVKEYQLPARVSY